ncbi:MAG: isoleucine--tRNA ligase [bacterium]|nr:isoleucine--tRNA ligase [bacterium]
MFKDVDNLNFPELECAVLEFWDKHDTFHKLREQNAGNRPYSFIDGPITANNARGIGVHHAWGRTYKDIFQRYKAMKGFDQRYQNGFDCQGLWVEVEVEKDLGLNSKKDILEFGMDNFSRKCRERVDASARSIIETSRRLGQWMDWEGSYYTYSDTNIEYIWHFLKACHEKGWLYKGHRVMPWCARCGTSLSQHELTDSYDEMTHRAVYLKLPIQERPGEYILVWTTTPWTLTSNVALAVHPELYYTKVKQGDEILYLSQGVVDCLEGDYEVLDAVKGEELVGLSYDGPFDELPAQHGVQHRVLPWDVVGEEEGTGVVHVAPGCGAEDYELGHEHGLPAIAPLDENGIYVDGFGEFSFQNVFEVAPMVFESLKGKGYLYKLEDYTHRYPRCWRCKEELVFRLVDEWFIRCDEIRPKMIEAARSVRWIPDHAGKRMEDWLNNMGDWCISRKRYWGLPMPFYETEDGELHIVGSREELRKLAVDPEVVDNLPELHRPWIDEVEIRTPEGKLAKRIPDVGDCWLDAGIVPFSTLHYLDQEDKGYWEQWFPADFISELREQIRLWFYSQLFMSVTLEGVAPYRTVMTYEKMNDEHGDAMHKSAGNAIWFNEAVEEMGAEPMRWLFADQNLSTNLNFGYGPASEVKRRFLTLWNTYKFFVQYANLDGIDPGQLSEVGELSLMDRWLLSRLQVLVRDLEQALESYNLPPAIRAVEGFFDDLSNWYVRLNRRRFWKSDSDLDKAAAYVTLHETLVTLSKILAPFLPFLAEEMYQNLVRSIDADAPESVHLCAFPEVKEERIDEELMSDMALTRQVVSLGRSARTESAIKVRQPLSTVQVWVQNGSQEALERCQGLILHELNVKTLSFVSDPEVLMTRSVKPNFRSLGKKYGKLMPQIKTALEELDGNETAARLEQGEAVELKLGGETVTLMLEDVQIHTDARESLAVVEDHGVLVALETALSEDLEDEGFAREFVHFVQNLRKEIGLDVSDRIELTVETGDRLVQAIQKHIDYVRHETLCKVYSSADVPDGHAGTINGESVRVAIRRL